MRCEIIFHRSESLDASKLKYVVFKKVALKKRANLELYIDPSCGRSTLFLSGFGNLSKEIERERVKLLPALPEGIWQSQIWKLRRKWDIISPSFDVTQFRLTS